MSKLAQFRRAEKALKEQLVLLGKLQGDSCLKREMQFEDQLKELMRSTAWIWRRWSPSSSHSRPIQGMQGQRLL